MKQSQAPNFSFEFFPPRNLLMQRRFWRALGQLESISPDFFSITYGALGSAKQISIETALLMSQESAAPVAAHLTCAEGDSHDLKSTLQTLYHSGINRIVALRGDAIGIDQRYAFTSTIEFIEFIKEVADFDISVAAYPEGHPEAISVERDIEYLKDKFNAGATRAITQFFFSADSYLRFRDKAQTAGIDSPIVPGILPILDFDKASRFARDCGASLPDFFETAYTRVKNDHQGTYNLSRDLTVALCETLMSEGVEDFHFYTMNKAELSLDISLTLGAELSSNKVSSAA